MKLREQLWEGLFANPLVWVLFGTKTGILARLRSFGRAPLRALIPAMDRMYVLDLWRKQASSYVWIDAFCDLVALWKPMTWAEEQGQIKTSVGPFLDRRQRERKAYVWRKPFPTRGDKAVRAQSIRGRMALEGLYLPSEDTEDFYDAMIETAAICAAAAESVVKTEKYKRSHFLRTSVGERKVVTIDHVHPRATGVTDLRDHAVRIGAEALARGILQNRTDGPSVAVARACHCGLRVQDQHRDAASADGEGQRNEQN